MSNFEQVMSVVLFLSALVMLVALWRAPHQNRLLGISLLVIAFTTFVGIALHVDRLREGSVITVLNGITGTLWIAAGIVALRKHGA